MPTSILKVKEWLSQKNAQFEVLQRKSDIPSDFKFYPSLITKVRRLNDGLVFSIGPTHHYGYFYDISGFTIDLIHVWIKQWKNSVGNPIPIQFSTSYDRLPDKMIPINELKCILAPLTDLELYGESSQGEID